MGQMVEAIAFIHSLNVIHFDISLENWLINDVHFTVTISEDKRQKMKFNLDDIHIKLCDFGLAQLFTKEKCLCSKYCGKEGYKSPESIARKALFDAKANDIWGLGTCLFMMISGSSPWNVAHESDGNYLYVMKRSMFCLLNDEWNIIHFVDKKMMRLLNGIFQSEEKRASISQIRKIISKQ